MKKQIACTLAVIGAMLCQLPANAPVSAVAATSPVMEYLDRGITAVGTGSGMLISWRFLANDPNQAVYKLYRDNQLIYTSTETGATCFLDSSGSEKSAYKVECYDGTKLISSDVCKMTSANAYFDVPLKNPGSGYTPNDCSVGDVDGDGTYELFVKWDPNNSKDNSQKGKTGNVYIDCYKLDGTQLWRIDLGVNIRAGAHYTQFYVADFDLDGKAEMTCKTADGTKDAKGTIIGDGSKDYRNSDGYILSGNEYYTLFDGATGTILDTVNYEPARGTVSSWGDKYGNRVDRFWGTTAYLDGVHPCVVTGRGYYTRMTATAYKVENKKLVKLWNFDTGNNSSVAGYGDGNHNSMAADVDGDGKQEILTGSTCIDDNGTVLWCTNQGHGDAMHVGDLDPSNPGLEEWICHEDKSSGYGVTLIDCDTGKQIFHNNGSGDTGRCCADNVWAGNNGAELWGNGNEVKDTKGNTLDCRRPAINFLSYWDGDLEREILDGYTDSPATISKMTGEAGKTTITNLLVTDGYYTCNTTKGTPCLSADIFGDWREELIVRAADGNSVRIYTTTYNTDYRITTLMHDPQYRTQVSAQNTAYNQPPHTSFYLGSDQPLPARPNVTVNGGNPVIPAKEGAVIDTSHTYRIKNLGSGLYLEVKDNAEKAGTDVQQGNSFANGWRFEDAGNGYYYLYSEIGDGKTYLLDLDYGKQENGTNIGIYTNTNSDAQLFKLVKNSDDSYTICTKVTNDNSCLGISSDSLESGATVIEWECNGKSSQSWTLEIKTEPIQGNLIKDLNVNGNAYYQAWSIAESSAEGDLLYGDRDVVYLTLPETLKGAERILPACDAKNVTTDLAEFTVSKDCNIYIAMDTRVETLPAWLSDYTKTDMTFQNNKDVTFAVYEKAVSAGNTVTLGTNNQSAYCVNYTVFVKEKGSQKLKGNVNADNSVNISDILMMQKWLHGKGNLTDWQAGDMNDDGIINIYDLILLKKMLLNQ